jgi:vancomycin permeability regulator SanA
MACIGVAAAVAAALGAGTATSTYVVAEAAPLTFTEVDDVPHRSVAIVFGVLVEADGTPSPRLADRLETALALYRAGRVDRLLMTGDGLRPGYDEVGGMRSWVTARGVPAEVVDVDPAGLDTYDSCLRAHDLHGIRDAVVITQAYHSARALHLCRRHGIDAVALAAPDWGHHPERAATRYSRYEQARLGVREWLARANALVDLRRQRPPAADGR